MSIKTLTCYIAACDDCGNEYEHDYTPHWPTAGEALDDATGSGEWWGDETLLLCSNCKLKPHLYTPSDVFEGCGRCDLDEDEHTAVTESVNR